MIDNNPKATNVMSLTPTNQLNNDDYTNDIDEWELWDESIESY